MDKQEFLSQNVPSCASCGNKIRPRVKSYNDGQCTLDDIPVIECSYCNISAGVCWPEEFEECTRKWSEINA